MKGLSRKDSLFFFYEQITLLLIPANSEGSHRANAELLWHD